MEQRRLYVVRGVAKNGTITYKCPTAEWAVKKLRDLKTAGRWDITVTDPDGVLLTEAALVGILEGKGTPLTDEAVPAALKTPRLPAQT